MVNLESPLLDPNYRMPVDEVCRLRKGISDFLKEGLEVTDDDFGSGSGIVISAGGFKYFTCTYVLISTLRNLGCQLPIEVWYYQDELTFDMRSSLSKFNVTCRDMEGFVEGRPHGFLMKSLAILYSDFEEVLFLDADNNCVKDPTYLFQVPQYLEHGCIFWPDYWMHSPNNQIWEIFNLPPQNCPEQESGQLLINKKKCWQALQLAVYLNINSEYIYRFMYGDKDSYRIAWMYLEVPYFFIQTPPGSFGYMFNGKQFHGNTMSQYDPNGDIIFLHRNLIKWHVTYRNERLWQIHKSFKPHAKDLSCNIRRHKKTNYIDLVGDVDVVEYSTLIPNLEEACLRALSELRGHPFYQEELLHSYIRESR
ncbi:alpha 1,2-mannosyltransferase [Pedobacter terrae]|uniref:Alpha 1,2-mannosyltransferase n=1 Tax=Pedobacter terrae TaxID=405671 RepID=A0A1G8CI86_9SPHI|nr:hypothetical protein [Pedobacter terrae]SDH45191.1 alpha 1,2-mannosyltransferase [Pedobacter terrae]